MIVADASLLVELWLPGNNFDATVKVLNTDSDWIAPGLWRSEFRNTIAKYLRANLIDLDFAHAAMIEGLEFMSHREHDVNSYRIIDLIGGSRVSAYDAEYIALAQETESRLVTFDRKLINLFPDVAIHPEDFLNETSS
jgi:predicted nucleic acid-binding protein